MDHHAQVAVCIPGDKGHDNIYRSMRTNINLKYFAKRSGHIDSGMIQLQNASKWRHRALSCLSLPLFVCLSGPSLPHRALSCRCRSKSACSAQVTWLNRLLGRCVSVYSLPLSLPRCQFLFLCVDSRLRDAVNYVLIKKEKTAYAEYRDYLISVQSSDAEAGDCIECCQLVEHSLGVPVSLSSEASSGALKTRLSLLVCVCVSLSLSLLWHPG
jgi:hypothetical protein